MRSPPSAHIDQDSAPQYFSTYSAQPAAVSRHSRTRTRIERRKAQVIVTVTWALILRSRRDSNPQPSDTHRSVADGGACSLCRDRGRAVPGGQASEALVVVVVVTAVVRAVAAIRDWVGTPGVTRPHQIRWS